MNLLPHRFKKNYHNSNQSWGSVVDNVFGESMKYEAFKNSDLIILFTVLLALLRLLTKYNWKFYRGSHCYMSE